MSTPVNNNLLDRPEISGLLFYPRPDANPHPPASVVLHEIQTRDGVYIGGRSHRPDHNRLPGGWQKPGTTGGVQDDS